MIGAGQPGGQNALIVLDVYCTVPLPPSPVYVCRSEPLALLARAGTSPRTCRCTLGTGNPDRSSVEREPPPTRRETPSRGSHLRVPLWMIQARNKPMCVPPHSGGKSAGKTLRSANPRDRSTCSRPPYATCIALRLTPTRPASRATGIDDHYSIHTQNAQIAFHRKCCVQLWFTQCESTMRQVG